MKDVKVLENCKKRYWNLNFIDFQCYLSTVFFFIPFVNLWPEAFLCMKRDSHFLENWFWTRNRHFTDFRSVGSVTFWYESGSWSADPYNWIRYWSVSGSSTLQWPSMVLNPKQSIIYWFSYCSGSATFCTNPVGVCGPIQLDYGSGFWLSLVLDFSSVPDLWHFDTNPDPRIHTTLHPPPPPPDFGSGSGTRDFPRNINWLGLRRRTRLLDEPPTWRRSRTWAPFLRRNSSWTTG